MEDLKRCQRPQGWEAGPQGSWRSCAQTWSPASPSQLPQHAHLLPPLSPLYWAPPIPSSHPLSVLCSVPTSPPPSPLSPQYWAPPDTLTPSLSVPCTGSSTSPPRPPLSALYWAPPTLPPRPPLSPCSGSPRHSHPGPSQSPVLGPPDIPNFGPLSVPCTEHLDTPTPAPVQRRHFCWLYACARARPPRVPSVPAPALDSPLRAVLLAARALEALTWKKAVMLFRQEQ